MPTPSLHIICLHLALTPENEARFRSALAPLGVRVTMRSCVRGTGGDAYAAHALELRRHYGGVWAGLKAKYGPSDARTTDRWLIFSWSAGYGLVREMLRSEGVPAELAGYCASDTIYGGDDDPRPDIGTPTPEHVDAFVPLALQAHNGLRAFVLAAGDVQTSYATTRQMAAAIAERVGVELEARPAGPHPCVVREGRAGRLLVRWYDAAPGRGTAEHLAFAGAVGAELLAETARLALELPVAPPAPTPPAPTPTGQLWEPGYDLRLGHRAPLGTALGDAVADLQRAVGAKADGWWGTLDTDPRVRAWQRAHGLPARSVWGAAERAALEVHVAPTEPAPSSGACAFGAAVLAEALADISAGVRESPPGSNNGPEVGAYLRALGVVPPANWCAAGATAWLRRAAARLGIPCPVAGSAGAQALGAQARSAGATWYTPHDLQVDSTRARPGSLIVWRRGPPGSWMGHVGVVERVDGWTLFTVEANSGTLGDRVSRMVRRLDDPLLLGVADLEPAVHARACEAGAEVAWSVEPRSDAGVDPLLA